MTLRFFLDNAWRWKCGISEQPDVKTPSLDELKSSEWSDEFELLMRNRLIMGAIRYGCLGTQGKPQYDLISSAIKRLYTYDSTGNKELLVDVANLCLVEFVECRHPKQHFHSTDDGEHAKSIKFM